MVEIRFLCRQAAIKVVARLVEKVGESIRKQYGASQEDLALMIWRRNEATVRAWKLRRAQWKSSQRILRIRLVLASRMAHWPYASH
jgi:hypothetical protein